MPSAKHMRVLLVESDEVLRTKLAWSLQGLERVKVGQVNSFAAALKAISASAPSLIISSLVLPDGSGLDLVNEIGERGLPVPFIIICDDVDAFPELTQSGNVRLLESPVRGDELLELTKVQLAQSTTIPPSTCPFAVADYLQLASMANRSLKVEVTAGGRWLGEILVMDGHAYRALDIKGGGTEAFCRLAMSSKVDVAIKPLPRPPGEQNIEGNLQELLFEAARAADERRRDGDEDMESLVGFEEDALLDALPTGSSVETAELEEAELAPPLLRTEVLPPPVPPEAVADVWGASIPDRSDLDGEERQSVLPKSLLPTLAAIDGLDFAAFTDASGVVLSSEGEADLDVCSDLANHGVEGVRAAMSAIGLTEPGRWHVSTPKGSWYVLAWGGGRILAKGSPSNPRKTLRQLSLVLETVGTESD